MEFPRGEWLGSAWVHKDHSRGDRGDAMLQAHILGAEGNCHLRGCLESGGASAKRYREGDGRVVAWARPGESVAGVHVAMHEADIRRGEGRGE